MLVELQTRCKQVHSWINKWFDCGEVDEGYRQPSTFFSSQLLKTFGLAYSFLKGVFLSILCLLTTKSCNTTPDNPNYGVWWLVVTIDPVIDFKRMLAASTISIKWLPRMPGLSKQQNLFQTATYPHFQWPLSMWTFWGRRWKCKGERQMSPC